MSLPLTCSVKGNSYFFSKKQLSFNDSMTACGKKEGKLIEVFCIETWNLLSKCLEAGNYRFRTGVTACYTNQSLVSTLSNDTSCKSSSFKLVNPIIKKPCSSFVINLDNRLSNSTEYITALSSNCSLKEKYICETVMENDRDVQSIEFLQKYLPLVIVAVALLTFLLIVLIYCYKKSSTNGLCYVYIKRDRPSIIIRRRREKLSQIRHTRVDSPTLSFCQTNQVKFDAMKSSCQFRKATNEVDISQDTTSKGIKPASDGVSSIPIEGSKNEKVNLSYVVESEDSINES